MSRAPPSADGTLDGGERRKRRGRPVTGGRRVGREGLIEVTREILKVTPPAAVTRQMIAERAGVDPTLIRYHFGSVAHLIARTAVDTYRRIDRPPPGSSRRRRRATASARASVRWWTCSSTIRSTTS